MMKKDVFYSKLKHWLESNGISAIKVIAPVKPLDMIHIDKSRIKSCDGFMFNGNKLFQDLKVFIDVNDNILGLSIGQFSPSLIMVLNMTKEFCGLPFSNIRKRNDDNIHELYC